MEQLFIVQYIRLCMNPGALVVFGGFDDGYDGFDGGVVFSTLEILNGTTWVTEQLKYPRAAHAMVVLPCP